jgi:hypothetical protein
MNGNSTSLWWSLNTGRTRRGKEERRKGGGREKRERMRRDKGVGGREKGSYQRYP